jgi:SWIM zinc finger
MSSDATVKIKNLPPEVTRVLPDLDSGVALPRNLLANSDFAELHKAKLQLALLEGLTYSIIENNYYSVASSRPDAPPHTVHFYRHSQNKAVAGSDYMFICTCSDFQHRRKLCKHAALVLYPHMEIAKRRKRLTSAIEALLDKALAEWQEYQSATENLGEMYSKNYYSPQDYQNAYLQSVAATAKK